MDYAENILGTIGNTPLVKLNTLVKDLLEEVGIIHLDTEKIKDFKKKLLCQPKRSQ